MEKAMVSIRDRKSDKKGARTHIFIYTESDQWRSKDVILSKTHTFVERVTFAVDIIRNTQ
jgi:hypothetical protein